VFQIFFENLHKHNGILRIGPIQIAGGEDRTPYVNSLQVILYNILN
jgi:hypothetical protein